VPKTAISRRKRDAVLVQLKKVGEEVDQQKKGVANKARLVQQSSQPTLTASGEYTLWRDTDDGKLYFVVFDGTTSKKVELT
jgi:hypothetical protein